MSSFQLQLIPAHNEKAGRNLPLSLGRIELARWWWHSCSCRSKTTTQPCTRCLLVARKTKSFSRKIFCMTKSGSLTVVTRKNRNILWYNGEPMCKSSDSTPILLQPGDTISIGSSDVQPWLDFYVKRIPIPITPDSPKLLSNNMFRSTAATSKKRLCYTYPDSGISADTSSQRSSQQLSLDDSLECRNTVYTQSSLKQKQQCSESSAETTKKTTRKRKKTSMSPKRLMEQTDMRARGQTSSTMYKNRKDDSTSVELRNAWMATRRITSVARSKEDIHMEHMSSSASFSLTHVPKKARKECSQREVPSSAESNETSVLSLPQCPTWNDDEDGQNGDTGSYSGGIQQEKNHRRSSRFPQQESSETKGPCSQAFHEAGRGDTGQSQDDVHSPAIQFASSLSLSQWKQVKQLQDTTLPSGRVRHALASLVVAQRVRGDSTWFPTILQGAVIDELELT